MIFRLLFHSRKLELLEQLKIKKRCLHNQNGHLLCCPWSMVCRFVKSFYCISNSNIYLVYLVEFFFSTLTLLCAHEILLLQCIKASEPSSLLVP
jgi:hypothetical protein